MAAEGIAFDEELLFTEFEVEKAKTVPLKGKNNCNENSSSKCLMEENLRLKKSLKTLITILKCGRSSNGGSSPTPEDCSPLFQVTYFDNSTSIRTKEKVEEFVQSMLSNSAGDNEERESFGSENFQPSVFELNYELDKLGTHSGDDSIALPIISSVQYYEEYCIDCCGFPLVDQNPRITDGWNIPTYEQVYFNVVPFNQETPRVKIKPSRTCFNCGNCGHNVQDCPEPQDLAKINANRRDFRGKFVSPVSLKHRYHGEESTEKRFGGFKAGVISDNLKEALGLSKEDLPLYIYRMRYHGYPPGYLPRAMKPSLNLYDGDGNIDNYVVEEESGVGDNICRSFIEYPGFNVPPPEGVRDNYSKLGMWPMQAHQRIENLADLFQQNKALSGNTAASHSNRKRKIPEMDRVEQDMDVDEDGTADAILEVRSANVKRQKYDLKSSSADDNDNGYSPLHPGLQCGLQEQELLKRFRQHGENSSTNNVHPQNKIKRKISLEEGEVISDEEGEDVEEENDADDDYPENLLGWWLKEPLVAVSTMQPKLSPPPKPSVQLPLEALSRFYTNSTVLQKMSFEDRVMWLDPIYGNLQPVSGRYDRLRKLLGKRNASK